MKKLGALFPLVCGSVFGLCLQAMGGSGQSTQQMLCDFETAADLAQWEFGSGRPRRVSEGHTHGRYALEIRFDPRGRYHPAYMTWRRVRHDWSAYDALELDVTNPGGASVPAYVLIADQAWAAKGRTYWNRHNETRTLPPGRTTWTIPVHGLYRGEAGSRNNDIKSDIDPRHIVRLDFGFGRRGESGRILLDALRLVKATPPPGVYAFDFGPPSQAVMPGWTPISNRTRYTRARGWGWGPHGGTPWNGAARDTTFGPPLIRDFCQAGGYEFHIDAPPGRYRVMAVFENSGYWGGEQARETWRRIQVNGKLAWHEENPDGPARALYRFENLEPIGKNRDIWSAYMEPELAHPNRFDVVSGNRGLTFHFASDGAWGCKISALALYRTGDSTARRWLARQWATVAAEFRSAAVCLDKPPRPFLPPRAWRKIGLAAWETTIEDTIVPNSTPSRLAPTPESLHLEATAVRGEYEPFCLAVRPLRALGTCGLRLRPTGGPGRLPARIDVVFYCTGRGFGNIAWHTRPHTLRARDAENLPAGITREFIITVHVPANATPGLYSWNFEITAPDRSRILRVPLALRVHSPRLDRTSDFLMGFYGLMPPGLIPEQKRRTVLEQTLRLIREHGMNAVSGGPSWKLLGWRGGEPRIDFGTMDDFFRLLRNAGFTRPINGYGGIRFRGLSDGYEKGKTGARVERESGLPYPQAVMKAWAAVDRHARQQHWPTILYAMCDETRVRAEAERQLAFMKIMRRVSRAFPKTLRTSGSYSVTFSRQPKSADDMLYWRQQFFQALDVSALNHHDPTVMAEARRLGREIHIYNQGRTRYSFGLYQWSEARKGVRARWQWHLNILYGYQFFDLDAREPDTAMLCYGRNGLYPTIDFERCREGAEDFYLLQQLDRELANPAKVAAHPAAAARIRRWLNQWNARVKLNQRRPPPGYDAARIKARAIRALETLESRAP